MLMSKKEKKLLNKVKEKAYTLKSNGQIPVCLYNCILDLNYDSKVEEVLFLKELCEKHMRVVGLYIRFPEYDKACKNELRMKGYKV